MLTLVVDRSTDRLHSIGFCEHVANWLASARDGDKDSVTNRAIRRIEYSTGSTLTSPESFHSMMRLRRGGEVSSVVEHLLYTQGVVGSSPSPPTKLEVLPAGDQQSMRGRSSVG